MNERIRYLSPVLICLVVAGLPAAGDPPQKGAKQIETEVRQKLFADWVHVAATVSGKQRIIPREDRMVYQYRADGLSQYLLVGEVAPFCLADELTLDTTADPMRITRTRKGTDGVRRVMKEIFKFDGDKLVTATTDKGEFPAGFESTAANKVEVHVFEPESPSAGAKSESPKKPARP
jgi:uncharacterized protein (TIGR03067 family)